MKQCAGNAFNCFSRRFSLCTIRVRNSPKTTKSAFRFLPCVGAFALAPHPLLLLFEFYPLSCSFICFCKDRYCYAICITQEQKKSLFYGYQLLCSFSLVQTVFNLLPRPRWGAHSREFHGKNIVLSNKLPAVRVLFSVLFCLLFACFRKTNTKPLPLKNWRPCVCC